MTARRPFVRRSHTAPWRRTLRQEEGQVERSRTATGHLRRAESTLTAGVSVDGAGRQLGFGFRGVVGGMRSGVQRCQSLQHAQEAVGGGQLQVLLWDVADLATAVSGLKNGHDQNKG